MSYDYKAGKQRIENILNMADNVEKINPVPVSDSEFKFNNGIKSWISSIFVDIRNSTELFEKENDNVVAKMIRAFTSEIIAIMNLSPHQREIGIRGDCVYGVFATNTKEIIREIFKLCVLINTEINMLNKLFKKKGFKEIKVGIGFAVGNDVIVKAGMKGSGINSKVWTGTAVVTASRLSGYGEKYVNNRIVLSKLAYNNIIEELKKETPEYNNWIKHHSNGYYFANIIRIDFNNWINNGMK